MTSTRPHHVVIEVDRARFHSKLRDIEGWIAEWGIDAEVGSVLGSAGMVRVRFADEKAAYAFQRCFSGRAVALDEIAAALSADARDEDLYDQLAREYPD
jgi:hypothetical protein